MATALVAKPAHTLPGESTGLGQAGSRGPSSFQGRGAEEDPLRQPASAAAAGALPTSLGLFSAISAGPSASLALPLTFYQSGIASASTQPPALPPLLLSTHQQGIVGSF